MERSSEVSAPLGSQTPAGAPRACPPPPAAERSRERPLEVFPPGQVSLDLHGANPGRQERAPESSGYSPGAEPAWPELTVAVIGQLPDSEEAEGPRKPLGHALLAGQYGWGTDLQGQKDIPSVTWRDRNQI